MKDLISRKALQGEIENLYDLNYGERLIDPREFYEMVDNQKVASKEEKTEKANKEIRIIAQLLEIKTELQEKALEVGATNRTKNFIKQEIKGIDSALEIVKKETGENV